MATLFPGLSLFFASGLSSPGLLDCLALCLRYADLLYLWLCTHSLLAQGIRELFACPSPSSLLWFCEFRWVLFSPMIHTLRDGVTPAGSRLVCPRSERRLVCFPFPFGLFLHVVPALWDEVTIWVRCWLGTPAASRGCCTLFPFWFGFEPLSESSLRALSYRCVSWWSSLRPRVFGCP